MASTSSLGAQSSTSASQAQLFYDEFTKALRDMRLKIEHADEEGLLQPIFEDVSRARSLLTEKTEELPSYDRQIHEQNLRQVHNLLAERRAQLAPKPRFAFKRKPKPAAVSTKNTTAASPPPAGLNSEEACDPPHRLSPPPSSSTFLSIRDRKGEIITASSLPTSGPDLPATDLHILNLQDCLVDLRQRGGRRLLALQLRNLSRCVVLCGTVEGSTMIHDCTGSLIALECRQFRMHSSHSIAVLLSTSSAATIEHCRSVIFAPLSTSSSLPSVQDFDHISTLQRSANWSSMPIAAQESIAALLATSQLHPATILASAGVERDQVST